MDLDEQTNGSAAPDATMNGSSQEYDALLAEAMQFGQVLQRDYRGEPDDEHNKTLQDIFSLVAYENPRDSVHGSLLDRKGRVAVAEELNSAILGKSPPPPPAQQSVKEKRVTDSFASLSLPGPLPLRRARKSLQANRSPD
jgi:hypothetical protein